MTDIPGEPPREPETTQGPGPDRADLARPHRRALPSEPAQATARPRTRVPGARGDTLGLRLALGFLGVALMAIGLLAGLTVIFASADVSSLVHRQREELTQAIAAAAAAAFSQNDSWAGANLSTVLDVATGTGADAEIRDITGTFVASSAGFIAREQRPQFSAPVHAHGMQVGEVIIRFGGSGIGGADRSLRSGLLRAIAAAAGLAALVALLTGLAVARRLTRPVAHIIAVTRARGRGERTARVGRVQAPDELRELAVAFDQMAEMLDRHEQVRRDLVADIAHELRTPMAILQAGHEALLDEVAEPTPEELVSLRDEVLRLAQMVDDLQVLAAADAAALQLELVRCDLADIAAAAADSLAGRYGMAGHTLDRELESAEVFADPRWLHQVVTNLLTNALKFSPSGSSVLITVRRAGDEAVLEVTDRGVGIPAEDLPRIFDRFWRGRLAAQTSGSGIGLAIAAELARAHGGTLAASSSPGQGTRMILALQLAAPAGRSAQGRRRGRPG
jgi:two-component system, OmpR family, sensor histidine kinase BaeS